MQARISCLQATERIRDAQWMGIAANLFFLMVSACIFVLLFGMRGVFMAFPASQILTLAAAWLIGRRRAAWVLGDDACCRRDPEDAISYPLATGWDCSLASEQVALFCCGHRLEERKGLLAGLCVEELASNALEHGGLSGRSVDLRVVIDGSDVVIRLRDSGCPFDLKRYAARWPEGKRQMDGLGIRLILHAAKDVSCYRAYGMNTTIVRV